MFNPEALDLGQWQPRTSEEILASARNQTIEIGITEEDFKKLSRSLKHSKKRKGVALRNRSALSQSLGLAVGDRLIAGGDLEDHIVLPLRLKANPGRIRFFRPSAGILSFACRWLEVPGFKIPGSLRPDSMHCLCGGLVARYNGTVIHRLMSKKFWEDETREGQLRKMLSQLRAYYKDLNSI